MQHKKQYWQGENTVKFIIYKTNFIQKLVYQNYFWIMLFFHKQSIS